MIPNAPTTVGFVSTPILLQASSNLLNFSRESTWRKIRKSFIRIKSIVTKFMGTSKAVSLVSDIMYSNTDMHQRFVWIELFNLIRWHKHFRDCLGELVKTDYDMLISLFL